MEAIKILTFNDLKRQVDGMAEYYELDSELRISTSHGSGRIIDLAFIAKAEDKVIKLDISALWDTPIIEQVEQKVPAVSEELLLTIVQLLKDVLSHIPAKDVPHGT